MIRINLSDMTYENDVYPLVKAFYPEEGIKVDSTDDYLKDNHLNFDKSVNMPYKYIIDVSISNNNIKILLYNNRIEETSNPQLLDWVEHSMDIDSLTKAKFKNLLKRLLYNLLSKYSEQELPWGILTGIRPTKLVYEMLEQGSSDAEIFEIMRDEYLCSDEKIEMSLRIAKREMALLKYMDYKNGYSLYIGIPFCPTTCLYCSFTSYSIEKFSTYVESYLDALEKEIIYGSSCFSNKKLTTVYLGGGTPTTLSAEQLDRLLGLIKNYYDFSHVKEFCVEAGRPDSITKEKLQILKKWGVDRISINPQSMQQKTLDLIGRKHSIEQIKEAFSLARETGHENINMDIIIGLPGENATDVEDTLRQIKEMNPDSLTVHTLALKRAARLNQEKEDYIDLRAKDVAEMFKATLNFVREEDYQPYYLYRQKNMAENLENIGYARAGKEGLYNILIMEEQQTILALGAGALSKFVFHKENRIERVSNVKSVTEYINRIDEMIQRKQEFLLKNGGLL